MSSFVRDMRTGNYVVLLFALFLSLIGVDSLHAQEKKLVQFSGIIYNIDSNVVVPYVTVKNLSHNNRTFNANHQGYFSFVAHEGDTISFTSVGYLAQQFVIPKVEDDRYTARIHMKAVITEIPMVTPYPWASIDEFNIAFMALEIADDEYELAKKNTTAESLAMMARNTPRSAAEIQSYDAMQNHIDLSNKAVNQRGANPLLSPMAWGAFIKQITEGNKSRANRPNY